MKKILMVVIILLAFFAPLITLAPELSAEIRETKELIKQNERDLYDLLNVCEFSEVNLRELLVLLKVERVEIIIEQMKLETGHFTSPLFLNHNNLTGMHFAIIRDSYAYEFTIADNGRKCSSYRSWQSSVLDFLLRIDYYENLGYSTDNYYSFLENTGYCEKGGYADLLRSMVKNSKS